MLMPTRELLELLAKEPDELEAEDCEDCSRCGCSMWVDPDLEPSPVCHPCAATLVGELARVVEHQQQRIARHERDAEMVCEKHNCFEDEPLSGNDVDPDLLCCGCILVYEENRKDTARSLLPPEDTTSADPTWPVQGQGAWWMKGQRRSGKPPCQCSDADARRAHAAYAKMHDQSFERLMGRGGFGHSEMDKYAPGWTPLENTEDAD